MRHQWLMGALLNTVCETHRSSHSLFSLKYPLGYLMLARLELRWAEHKLLFFLSFTSSRSLDLFIMSPFNSEFINRTRSSKGPTVLSKNLLSLNSHIECNTVMTVILYIYIFMRVLKRALIKPNCCVSNK